MQPLSLKERILRYLKAHPEWMHGEDIARMAQSAGYEAESGRRRLRDLMEEGLVETESRKGKRTASNVYRYKRPVLPEFIRTQKLFENV